jgi:hypothetical protein
MPASAASFGYVASKEISEQTSAPNGDVFHKAS